MTDTIAKKKHEGPVRVPVPFDKAIELALRIGPPPGGWRAHGKRAKAKRRKRKPAK